MTEVALGLPNQALKPLVSTFQSTVLQTIPFERHAELAAVGAEANVFPGGALANVFTFPTNKKVSLSDILVKSGAVDDMIFRFYRNGVQVLQYEVAAADDTERVDVSGVPEFDEGETLRVTASSVTGGGLAVLDLLGREELKRNELFSQVIA